MVEEIDKTIPTHPENIDEERNTSWAGAIPPKQGLYDPELEKDSCGVGFTWYALSFLFTPANNPATSKA
jgi:hypothetical protein